jgi:hypothetical protein
MKQFKFSQSFAKEFKMKKIVLFPKLKVIMVENLTILILKTSYNHDFSTPETPQ